LDDEIDWETVTREGDYLNAIVEESSVTRRIRRVARFTPAIVRNAITTNAPTKIVLNHIDYLSAKISRTPTINIMTFIHGVERSLRCPIDLLGFGPGDVRVKSSSSTRVEKIYA
jgi:adenylosuccinate synthase